MNNELISQIKLRKDKLEEVKIKLKEKFIGIDDVIDKIISSISLWYIMPEVLFKPHIISLWGITGVGKTDLVRTLVKLLEYTDKFIEIQMDMENDYLRNVEDYLERANIENTEPAILLLDEIQRYRTIDEMGGLINNKYFNDIWMLLSDGKFKNNSNRRSQVMDLLLEELYWKDNDENDSNGGESVPDEKATKNKKSKPKNKTNVIPKIRKYNTSYWSANRFKKLLNLSISVEDVMKMNVYERMEIMEDALKMDGLNEGKSYEKLLIFISGNLDSAFKMAEDVDDSESDADIYHEISKRVNIINIKQALSVQFKPEQIARFGNNHIIYPCLNKESYEKIIKLNSEIILNKIYNEHKLSIKLSKNVYDLIYRNGVFPTQGVRPAISTVFNVLGSNLPHFIYLSLISDESEIFIDYEEDHLFAKIKDNIERKKIVLELDDIRKNKSIDEKTLIMVHELGHALVYALQFNTPPKQININSTNFSDGFIIKHNSIDNKTFLLKQLTVILAGIAAEEYVFGDEYKTTGGSADINNATDLAGRYVRFYGMDTTISFKMKKESQSPTQANYDVDSTNLIIETLLNTAKEKAHDMLSTNIILFKSLIKKAKELNGMDIRTFVITCKKHNLILDVKEINDKLVYGYEKKLNDFLC